MDVQIVEETQTIKEREPIEEEEFEPTITIQRVQPEEPIQFEPLAEPQVEVIKPIQQHRQVQVTRTQDILHRSQRRKMPPGRATITPKINTIKQQPPTSTLQRFAVLTAPKVEVLPASVSLPLPPKEEPVAYTLDTVRAALFRRLAGGRCAFTSAGRSDGVGAQALGKITTKVMAKALNMDYAHHPFQILEHTDNNTKPGAYIKLWEQLLVIGGNSRTTFDRYPHSKHLDCNDLGRSLAVASLNDGWAYVVRDAHSFTNRFRLNLENEWREVIRDLRARYEGPRKKLFNRCNDTNPQTVHVAVHIRRGDATNRGPVVSAERVLSNDYFASVMAQVNTACSKTGKDCRFHIISEGKPSDFADLTAVFSDTELHLSEPSVNIHQGKNNQIQPRNQHLLQRRGGGKPLNTQQLLPTDSLSTADAFKLLVGADILIMSKSAFSFLAALYSTAIKIYPPEMVNGWEIPIWCEKEDKWIHVDKLSKDSVI
jgi:hypothetical protein